MVPLTNIALWRALPSVQFRLNGSNRSDILSGKESSGQMGWPTDHQSRASIGWVGQDASWIALPSSLSATTSG